MTGQSRKLIIDTDPGVDDAVAILLALAAPEVEVLGLTTVGGNVPLSRATRNTLALLEYAGLPKVPVAAGAARPLKGAFPYARHFHGAGGLTRRLPDPKTSPIGLGAVEFLARQLVETPGQLTLVALGPLTNLALLLRLWPGALERAQAVVVMGGAVGAPGNVTPCAEFNFYSDPLAAHEVTASGLPFTLVDLGACRRVFVSRKQGMELKSPDRLGGLAAQMLVNWFGKDPGREKFEFYDPLTLAAALKPDLLATRQVTIAVETGDGTELGMSRVVGEGGPVSVVERVDEKGFFGLLREALGLRGI